MYAVSAISLEMEHGDIAGIVDALLDRVVQIVDVPSSLRHIFSLISSTTLGKFESSRHAVSSFFFLRVLCPALVTPERFDIAVEDDRRRILLLISKIIMNVANVQSFGTKDPQLAIYNDLLESKYQQIVDFLTELGAVWPEPISSANTTDKSLSVTDADVDEEFIAFYVIKHLDRILQVDGIDANLVTSVARSVQQRQRKRLKLSASAQATAYAE
ncbi:hypothetical protein QFC19_006675 [Naganishia cerealis]|uniref:Uncharacterized protein n=1 Tax=Naganishia cerealis TaxID=610337 RepID=A0ACC2VER2_9TREE|nr:hypothetical protein QFC19_006675 [Naganishia cerealis]